MPKEHLEKFNFDHLNPKTYSYRQMRRKRHLSTEGKKFLAQCNFWNKITNKTLGPKQKKVVQLLARGYSKTKAIKGAGYKEERRGWYSIKKAAPFIGMMMDRLNITDDFLLEKLKEGLEADKVVHVTPTGEKVTHEDWASRHRYLDTALELKGHTGKTQAGPQIKVGNVVLIRADSSNGNKSRPERPKAIPA